MKFVCLLLLLGVAFAAPDQQYTKVDKRQAVVGSTWPNGKVFYEFSNGISTQSRQNLRAAMDGWEQRTCVRFTEDPKATDRILVLPPKNSYTCSSPRGHQGGVQEAKMGGCSGKVAMHELAHTLGVRHEHQRYDRDDYVTVHQDNINPNYLSDYTKLTKEESNNFDVPYEYGSIMHYSGWEWQVNISKPTMSPKDKKYINSLGYFGPTFYDALLINRLYKCFDKCPKDSVKCQNGGVVDVNNCAQCACPVGFGGTLCDKPSTGCTQFVPVTEKLTNQSLKMLGNFRNYNEVEQQKCVYVLQAPPGKRVKVTIQGFDSNGYETECALVGLEIRVGDLRNTGYRFCNMERGAPGNNDFTYTSDSNQAILVHYVSFGGTTASIGAVAVNA